MKKSFLLLILSLAACWDRDSRCTFYDNPWGEQRDEMVERAIVHRNTFLGRWMWAGTGDWLYRYEDCNAISGCPDETLYVFLENGDFQISRWKHELGNSKWEIEDDGLSWSLIEESPSRLQFINKSDNSLLDEAELIPCRVGVSVFFNPNDNSLSGSQEVRGATWGKIASCKDPQP